ncbi:hypothetical protein Lal_00027816 [Lupinus albus]|nr:hypothetical protein Lal_00027816 [Lupinus albus]
MMIDGWIQKEVNDLSMVFIDWRRLMIRCIEIEIHYLFTLVLDVSIKHIQESMQQMLIFCGWYCPSERLERGIKLEARILEIDFKST